MGLWKSRQGDHYFCNVCSKRLDVTKSRPGYVPANWYVQEGNYATTVCSDDCLNIVEERRQYPTYKIEGAKQTIEFITEEENETDYETIPGVPS